MQTTVELDQSDIEKAICEYVARERRVIVGSVLIEVVHGDRPSEGDSFRATAFEAFKEVEDVAPDGKRPSTPTTAP
ncbi:MAG: hypothetical protein AAF479_15630 [Pseudomonadota bacterium]